MNELSKETSPYLLQHAENPVHWKAWNDQSLALARSQNKLMIVSTGYSACHWCHVMEHESFENDEVAATMNNHFVAIKVDREERPDIDAVYMKAVQLMTGRGGWPMNVICLPDGRPVWGGTYFPRKEWISSLEQLAALYAENPEKMLDYAEKLREGIASIGMVQNENPDVRLTQNQLGPLVKKWMKSFDTEFGGYTRAPKFMMPANWKFLLRYGHQHQNIELLEHVNLTLTKMAWGGIFDTLGGGFSRYSVDMKWHVPHFEKMLYDNGQLVSLYSDAFKLTGNPLYKEIIEKTLAFVTRELANGEGGFFSALDADSINENGKLEEGAFFVWTKEQLQTLIGRDFEWFADVFNVNEFGHWEHGNFVLIQNQNLAAIAEKHQISLDNLQSKKKAWEQILFTEREKRSRPRLDDKCLTSWNAMMLKGFVDAYKALGNESHLETALNIAHFIVDKLWQPEGNLHHSYKNGKTTINAYLEDYAFAIDGFIAIYEVTFDEKWLRHAKQLADFCLDHFYDGESGFFAFTSNLDTPLITTHFEMEDNVIPASNSVMAGNLYKLSVYFSHAHYQKICLRMLQHVIPMVDYPSAFSNWLDVFMNLSEQNRELAICGSNALAHASVISKKYLPNVIVAGTEKPSGLPFLENRFVAKETLFYVCQDKTCGLPEKNLEETLKNLQSACE